MFRIGLIGFPNSGKTTLFNAMCSAHAEIAPYPFTTKDKNTGVLFVVDERLKALSKVLKSSEITPDAVEVVDVAGLIKGAHKGEGLGNEFLSYIRPLDLVIFILREFEGRDVPKVGDNSYLDFEVLKYEIAMSDFSILEKKEESLRKKKGDKKAQSLLEMVDKIKKRVEEYASRGKFTYDREFEPMLKETPLISAKPYIAIINTDVGKDMWDKIADDFKSKVGVIPLVVDALLELEMLELSAEEREEMGYKPFADKLVSASLCALNLISFFTGFEGEELKAYIVEDGITSYEAAGLIHSDMQKGFISCEVINWKELANAGSEGEARAKGLFRMHGRDYKVRNGDLIRIKFL